MKSINQRVGIALLLPTLAACLGDNARMGMVRNPDTGLMYGSVVERNIVTDADLYANRKIKLRIRNTSGDTAFDLHGFQDDLEAAYSSLGYQVTDARDFGIRIDVNVKYSGQIQTDLSREFTFLGAVSGAALGHIVGSFVKDDTYIIIARFTFSQVKWKGSKSGRSITFSRSPRPQDKDEEDEDKETGRRGEFKHSISTGVSVFAGGRNVRQSRITGEVRDQLVRIMRDII